MTTEPAAGGYDTGDGGDAVPLLLWLILALIVLAGIGWIIDVPRRLGVTLLQEHFLALVAGLATAGGLLLHPLPGRWRWLDSLGAAAAAAAWLWMAWNFRDWMLDMANRGPEKWVPGVVALLLMLEALRRSCGNAIAILVGVIAAYGFLGHLLPGPAEAAFTRPTRLVLYLYADSNGVPGLVLNVAASVVLGFIVFGAALRALGGAEVFTDGALRMMGRYRGGPAKVAILSSGLFGTVSGSTVANVMSSGVVTIPLMKRSGFPARYAAGIEAVASNGGQIAPPVMGATAFLIAEFLQVSYIEVVKAAIVPALIYYLVLFLQVDAYAQRHGLRGLRRDELPRLGATLRRGWVFLLPIALLVWLLFWQNWPPGRAALAAALACLPAGLYCTRILPGWRFWRDFLSDAGRTLVPILLISAAAGIVVGVVNITGIGFTLTMQLGQIGALYGMLPLLLVSAVAAIVLGMGMPTAAVYVVLSVLLAPALVRAGVEPMAAHLFILYFGLLSMITPPVAIATYAAASLARADFWQAGTTGLRLAVAAYLLPFAFCINPSLLLLGDLQGIVAAVVAALAAGYLLSLALTDPQPLRQVVLFALAIGVTGLGFVFATDSLLTPVLSIGACLLVRFVPGLITPYSQGEGTT
jgi:TRAP transporter 4TM/12TM fusion protein